MKKTITRPRADHSGQPLVTREFLAAATGRHINLVKRHCTPVACDVRNRALLYDPDIAERALAAVPRVRKRTIRLDN